MKKPNLWTLCLIAAAAAASAQTKPAPAPAPAKAAPAPAAAAAPAPAATPSPTPGTGPAGGEMIQSILEQELEAPRNGFIYNGTGRRDPFISLAKPVTTDDNTHGPKPPGIQGFLLQETSLRGVVKNIDGWIAVLEGPDKKGYFVRTGQRLYDGVIIAIDAAGFTFRQEITDPLSPAKSRDIRRLLNSAQEESKQ